MTNFDYNTDIPDGPNNPSNDQPLMKTNTNSIDGIIAVDHIGFQQNNGGFHTVIHQGPQLANPAAIPGFGQTFTKTISADQQLFYESGNGVVTQITSADGVGFNNVPVILSGTFASTGAFTNVVLLPANVYGYIIFFRTSATRAAQLSPFVTTGTTCHGMSSRMVTNGSSDDDPVELNNNSASLNLQGRTDDFGNQTYNFRLHYWSL